jgi:hypothetical protein
MCQVVSTFVASSHANAYDTIHSNAAQKMLWGIVEPPTLVDKSSAQRGPGQVLWDCAYDMTTSDQPTTMHMTLNSHSNVALMTWCSRWTLPWRWCLAKMPSTKKEHAVLVVGLVIQTFQ